MITILFILVIVAFVLWRLYKTNTDIRPQETYTADDTWNGPPDVQVVHYIQPREGKPL